MLATARSPPASRDTRVRRIALEHLKIDGPIPKSRLRVLVAAGLLAVSALSGLLEPAVGHAAFDKKSYDSCATAAEKRFVRGETNSETLKDEYSFCCTRSGGYWDTKKSACLAEPPARTAEPQVPQAPRPTVASTGA